MPPIFIWLSDQVTIELKLLGSDPPQSETTQDAAIIKQLELLSDYRCVYKTKYISAVHDQIWDQGVGFFYQILRMCSNNRHMH